MPPRVFSSTTHTCCIFKRVFITAIDLQSICNLNLTLSTPPTLLPPSCTLPSFFRSRSSSHSGSPLMRRTPCSVPRLAPVHGEFPVAETFVLSDFAILTAPYSSYRKLLSPCSARLELLSPLSFASLETTSSMSRLDKLVYSRMVYIHEIATLPSLGGALVHSRIRFVATLSRLLK